jgi:hypothetical protein
VKKMNGGAGCAAGQAGQTSEVVECAMGPGQPHPHPKRRHGN